MSKTATRGGTIEAVEVPVGATALKADLRVPAAAQGLPDCWRVPVRQA